MPDAPEIPNTIARLFGIQYPIHHNISIISQSEIQSAVSLMIEIKEVNNLP
jgi:hypothetical protein